MLSQVGTPMGLRRGFEMTIRIHRVGTPIRDSCWGSGRRSRFPTYQNYFWFHQSMGLPQTFPISEMTIQNLRVRTVFLRRTRAVVISRFDRGSSGSRLCIGVSGIRNFYCKGPGTPSENLLLAFIYLLPAGDARFDVVLGLWAGWWGVSNMHN
jgi:hypothetical protein